MRFEARALKPYSEPVRVSKLVEGSIYFLVYFEDEEMFVPLLKTIVFIGKNLEPADTGRAYFQNIESYRRGVRYPGTNNQEGRAEFHSGPEGHPGPVFEFEDALNELLLCSLRRSARNAQEMVVSKPAQQESRAKTETIRQRYLWFEDVALQVALLRELDVAAIPHTVDSRGGVHYGEAEMTLVEAIANHLRSAQFPCYLKQWPTEGQTAAFRAALKNAGLPFFIEHRESGLWFVVRCADQAEHSRLSAEVIAQTGNE